ncbi:uncharacterized protein LOC114963804 isoform X2 [Acropora millepora]|uniref:uncharacterized protein LOC114963804 isoform X2 n=1 Tax=Acropora millepora TaxID=45264 RepID=UPI001CF226F7|nr:uncharacterized protein LOC114963804 isoform X2 [Acropora millepora]
MDYTVHVNPVKATFIVKEVFEKSGFILRGIACAVRFKGSRPFLLTSSAVVEETDNRKKLIAERFSKKHTYLLDVSVLRQFGNVTFLWIMKEHQRAKGTSWIIALNLEIPSSERKALGRLLPETCPGAGNCRLQVQFDGSTQVIPAKSIDRASILGVPIIIENTQSYKKQSGRFSVIGVVGLTTEEKFCVCYLDHENTGSLDMLLSNRNGPEGPTNIEELVEEETSTAQTQAVAAFNLREQGPSASLETEDQRSLRECGETSTAQTQAIAAINLREQGPSASLETEDQRSLRECGGMKNYYFKQPSAVSGIYGIGITDRCFGYP